MNRVILSQQGFDKLWTELEYLKTKKRVEIAKQLEEARAHGDLRENAEYDTAKNEKAKLEARIAALEHKLANAKVVDLKDAPTDKIYLGTTADLKNKKTGDEVTFSIVSEDEADIAAGKIAVTSPIGKALLGHKVKETVEVQVPVGVIPYQILKIYRK